MNDSEISTILNLCGLRGADEVLAVFLRGIKNHPEIFGMSHAQARARVIEIAKELREHVGELEERAGQ